LFSTLRKIFKDKPIKSFELNYREDFYEREGKEKDLKARDVLIEPLTPDYSKVLDVGCGDGRLLRYLLSRKLNIEAVGVDISAHAVRIANEHGVKALCMDIITEEIPDAWEFDYIIMTEFIEHIPNPEKLLTKLRNHVSKSIIVSVPNTGYITGRLRLFIGGRFPIQWGKHPGEHIRFWTVKDLIWWADQLGYTIEKIIPVRGSLLKNVWPGLFSAKNILVLKKKH